MKRIITILLSFGMIFSDCSKKKDDNTLRNLLILGFLTAPKSETITMTPGVGVRQRLSVTAGQELRYTISQPPSASSSLTRNTTFNNRVTVSLLNSDNKEVYSTVTIPGFSDTITYTPTTSGQFTVVIIPSGTGTVTTSVSGATALNSLSSENSTTSALTGKRKYQIYGALVANAVFIINVNEVNSVDSTGKPIVTPITNANISLTLDGTSIATSYSNNVLDFMGPGFTGFVPFGQSALGKKIKLKITHPTISDINFDKEITAAPSPVTNVKANGISSAINSGTTLTLDKSLPVTFTWDIPTGVNKPDTTQLDIGNNVFIFIPADKGTYTLPKELLSAYTTSPTTDNCIGSIGGAGSSSVYDTEYFMGMNSQGIPFPSMFQVVIFNFNNSLQPNEGWFCEPGTLNPLTEVKANNPQNLPASPAVTFVSGGIPQLVVK